MCLQVASSISDGAGTISMDDEYNRTREQLRQQGGRTSGHVVAGMKGLGYGIFGGLTGVFTQPFEGAREDGVEVGANIVGCVFFYFLLLLLFLLFIFFYFGGGGGGILYSSWKDSLRFQL